MSRVLLALVAIACLNQAAARPVKKTLNFNMFVLRPRQDAEGFLLATDGVSRLGPVLEYLVQRVQGMMSVKKPQEKIEGYHSDLIQNVSTSIPNAAENEVDGVPESKMPGVIVRPSRTKPGTYEVEIDVVVDDDQPNDNKTQE